MALVRSFSRFSQIIRIKYLAARLFSQSRIVLDNNDSFFRLNEGQLSQYDRDGYLVVKDIFNKEEMQELIGAMDELIEMASKSLNQTSFLLDKLTDGETSKGTLLKRSRVICPSLVHPVWHKAIRHPKLLDMISQLVGSSSIRYLVQEKIHMKYPGEDGSFGIKWHQDWAFLPHTNDSIVTVGLAIDDSTEENGCLQVVPGTHKGPILSHFEKNSFVSSITDPTFDPSSAVFVEVPSGGASFHHVRTAHASGPNNSKGPRRVCFTQYCATDAWPLIGVIGPEGYGVTGPVDWERFCASVVRGSPTLFPRMENIPISLPFPYDRGHDVFQEDKSTEGNT